MADASNQEAGKVPVKETSDFAQSSQPEGAAKDTKPKPENQGSGEGRTPQAGR